MYFWTVCLFGLMALFFHQLRGSELPDLVTLRVSSIAIVGEEMWRFSGRKQPDDTPAHFEGAANHRACQRQRLWKPERHQHVVVQERVDAAAHSRRHHARGPRREEIARGGADSLVGVGKAEVGPLRSEERRVGKECRSWGSPDH